MPKGATWAEKLAAPHRGQEDHDAPGSNYGLKVRVFASGRKVWFIRGRVKGTATAARFVQLGDYPLMPQSDAELDAGATRKVMRQGIDPLQRRAAEVLENRAAAMTFGELFEEYLAKGTSNLRANTLKGRAYALRGRHFADWRDKPLAYGTALRIRALSAALPVTSHAVVLGSLRRAMRYGEENGYLDRAPRIEVKRAEGDAAPFFTLQEGGQPDFGELVAVLDALDMLEQQFPLSPWPQIWRFATHTGARPSAYLGLDWRELDLSSRATWHLPAERSKLARAIDIPLGEASAALLRALPRKDAGLIWPGRDGKRPREDLPGDQVGLIRGAMMACGFSEGFWPGRFRDTVMTWLDVHPEATERSIALLVDHKAPTERSTRGRHYAKVQSDALARRLVNEWAATIEEARGKARRAGPRVLPLRHRELNYQRG